MTTTGRSGQAPAGRGVTPNLAMVAAAIAVALGVLPWIGAPALAQGTVVAAPGGGRAPEAAGRDAGSAGFSGHGSIDQAYELGAPENTPLELVDAKGKTVGRGTTDRFGSLVIYNVAPGPGYRFRTVERATTGSTTATTATTAAGRRDPAGSGTVLETAPFRVLSTDSTPPERFYQHQHLHVGLNYLTMRDGISIAATVRLPPGKTLADGPFPTVIEQSGYAIAAPGSLLDTFLQAEGSSAGTKAAGAKGAATTTTVPGASEPLPDTATAVGSVIAPLLGFATVSVQLRGTGCSGGAFDLFGLPTIYDGYDVVQIVGSQPWVAHHKVGLVGISFSGISQWFTAGTRPPDLAAIAPMSSLDDFYSVGFPGGIPNDGFAAEWINQRLSDAQPAPGGGEAYATTLIDQGDRQCLANQRLHLQIPDVTKLLASPYRTPSTYNVRSPLTWARRINVPVFVTGALQDEQTGPEWEDLISALHADPQVWATVINGTHVDSLNPAIITRWVEFLDLFVARRLPHVPKGVAAMSGTLYQALADAPAEPLPALRFTHAPSVAAARADFARQDPRVRVLFDNGAGNAGAGAFQPEWQAGFSSWPPASAEATVFRLTTGGGLTTAGGAGSAAGQLAATVTPAAGTPDRAAPGAPTTSFQPNPAARPATSLPQSANPWAALPPYDWTPVTGSEGLGFVTAPLPKDLVVVGPASLDLWVRSTARNTDLQATISEVRPDGQEMYVQSGFLRASDRALDVKASTALAPVPTYLASQARSLPAGRYSLLRIPIDPIGFAFRAGSRLRVTLSAPGGDRPSWAFATPATGGRVTDTVGLGGVVPSALVLPVARGITPPDAQPPCPSLRGQPCRRYVPAGNGG